MSNLDKLFDDIKRLEKLVRKKFPKPEGHVKLANIKSSLDSTIGRSGEINDTQEIKWAIEYRSAMEAIVK